MGTFSRAPEAPTRQIADNSGVTAVNYWDGQPGDLKVLGEPFAAN